jgi:hypothetical protein
MHLREMSGCREVAQVKQDKHLYSSNVRHHKQQMMPTKERFCLIQNSNRASYISLRKPQAGKEQAIRSISTDACRLSRHLEALLSMRQRGLQVIPFVVNTG